MTDSNDITDDVKKAEYLAGRLEEVLAFRQSLTKESDRGCALIVAAYLDGKLAASIDVKPIPAAI